MNRFRRRPVTSSATSSAPKRKRFQISASTKRSLWIIAVLAIICLLMFVTAPFWVNWIWFDSMGYRSVLTRTYLAQGGTFVVIALISAILFLTNVKLALRNTKKFDVGTDNRFGRVSNQIINILAILGAALIAFAEGRYVSNRWEEALLFLNGRSFGVEDPTYGRDVGFYVFQVPFLRTLENIFVSLLLVTIAAVVLVYLVRMGIRFKSWGDVPMVALRHVSALLSAFLLVMALGYLLNNFELVFSSRGVVTGPGFTDSNIVRPLGWVMAIASVAAAIGLLTGFVLRNVKWLFGIIGIWLIASLVLMPLLPAAVRASIYCSAKYTGLKPP